ncbi:MAG: di-trans,poly-cis-decaprenylcistransferase [Candidatus Colwellbacteria bacterium RIFCSPLOWO2_12_FULL_44_13]|uniref:Di-trans,poly-cis-decaprenylcistransferase n=3 Tax=Candidatus Colwelliibacteriota TaxID=1817904 RepID=A0A1G1Z5K9_9BACT|nr:MAG: di-trans,poly-cis-decaprenylcistransferase [Candidatus Colwellbacteria bacterium RIFCSPHIGHO2_12_FULL_44_17]OGY59903.1 MAG: di-trans,poly-cis-decaprenylcistransferase [Candidatus Colwellbacteria bacterium RIFCSPLOWO2_02_FULL_44_20b]OGY61783.1 MAG: di-trans,poly-cis-decaprenylcistransferase [Candidatus Colwellbacteria bacterium RIFCSPLOWO2_12_FULL_44_13]
MNQQNTLHIAIIPDGNRRWAKKKRLQPWVGHVKGAQNAKKLVLDKKLIELGITHFTFWGSSKDNVTRRPKKEIEALFNLSEQYFGEMLNNLRELLKKGVCVRARGEWQKYYPKKAQEIIKRLVNLTKGNTKYSLTFLLAYDGREEMVEVIEKMKDQKKISVEDIKKYLWTNDLPPVDLLIRTGSADDPHLSAGFMMWDTAYAGIYFTDTLWPDFGIKELKQAVQKFSKTERRFGK